MQQFRLATIVTLLLLTTGCKSEPEKYTFSKTFDIKFQEIIDHDRLECNASALAVSIQGPKEENFHHYFSGTTTLIPILLNTTIVTKVYDKRIYHTQNNF